MDEGTRFPAIAERHMVRAEAAYASLTDEDREERERPRDSDRLMDAIENAAVSITASTTAVVAMTNIFIAAILGKIIVETPALVGEFKDWMKEKGVGEIADRMVFVFGAVNWPFNANDLGANEHRYWKDTVHLESVSRAVGSKRPSKITMLEDYDVDEIMAAMRRSWKLSGKCIESLRTINLEDNFSCKVQRLLEM